MATNLAKLVQFSVSSVVVTGIKDLTWDGQNWDFFDTTANDESLSKTSEKTLYDNGSFNLTLIWDPQNTQHALLRTLSNSRTEGDFEIEYPGTAAEHNTFSGWVSDFSFIGNVGDVLTAKLKVKVNGEFTAV